MAASRALTATRAPRPRPEVADAAVRTLAYADIFDYPLTAEEVHRDLVAVRAGFEEVAAALDGLADEARTVVRAEGHFALAGREATVETRRRRERTAAALWPRARRAARALAALPFVRAVAVTGSLAVGSVDEGADIDLLVVAAAGHVWTCRALVTAFARAASRRAAALCPNYVLSDGALAIAERSLYTAHELCQMVPLAGPATYLRLIEENPWPAEFLPNRAAAAPAPTALSPVGSAPSRLAERLLGGRGGRALERRARGAQASRLRRKIELGRLGGREAALGDEAYKGHFDAHGARILASWANRAARALGSG